MNITEFLEARITDEEVYAARDLADMRRSEIGIQFDCDTQKRFTPARVLAECAAKRAIIGLAQQATADVKEYDDYEWQGAVEMDEPYAGEAILLALAAVYKDHPDYQQEWAD